MQSALWFRPDLRQYDSRSINPTDEALNLLTTITANNSSTIFDTTHITGSYDEYLIIYRNLVPVINNDGFVIQITENSGGTWQNSNYQSMLYGGSTSSAGTIVTETRLITSSIMIADNNTNFFGVAGSTVTSGSYGLSGQIFLHAPNGTGNRKYFNGNSGWAGFGGTSNIKNNVAILNGFYDNDDGVINGVLFQATSSYIFSGTVKIYGLNT